MKHNLISDLIQKYLDGVISDDEFETLSQCLRESPESRMLFCSFMQLDAGLERIALECGEISHDQSRSEDLLNENQTLENVEYVNIKVAPMPQRIPENMGYGSRMRKGIQVLFILAVSIVLGISGYMMSRSKPESWATIMEGGPGVHIRSEHTTREAHAGDKINAGESIIVTEDSTAKVKLSQQGTAMLGPGTHIQCRSSDQSVELVNGFAEVATDIQKEKRTLKIRTPQAEAWVDSSRFKISSSEGRTYLRVDQGNLQYTCLKCGELTDLGKGKGVMVAEDLPPVVSRSRTGTALLIVSREKVHADWDKFNQIVTEKLLNTRLWQLGFRVDVKHFEDVKPSDLNNRALVIVSLFTCGVGEPALAKLDLAHRDVPVICLEPAGYPELGMSVGGEKVGFDFYAGNSPVIFSSPGHPLACGLDGSHDGILKKIVGWGKPAGNPVIISHLPEFPERVVSFAYDKNQSLANFPAPERRVGLFLDPYNITDKSVVSWKLLEAAVKWCVDSEAGSEEESYGEDKKGIL